MHTCRSILDEGHIVTLLEALYVAVHWGWSDGSGDDTADGAAQTPAAPHQPLADGAAQTRATLDTSNNPPATYRLARTFLPR